MGSLTEDVLAARSAGMTYGQWRAANFTPVSQKRMKKTLNGRRCLFCGKPLKGRAVKYCDAVCGQKYWTEPDKRAGEDKKPFTDGTNVHAVERMRG